jgi:hypothetical protein
LREGLANVGGDGWLFAQIADQVVTRRRELGRRSTGSRS